MSMRRARMPSSRLCRAGLSIEPPEKPRDDRRRHHLGGACRAVVALDRDAEAERRLKAAYDADHNTLRIVDAYARMEASLGRTDLAIQAYSDFDQLSPRHPLVRDALEKLKEGKPLTRLIGTAQEGAAEVLYGLGSAGSTQGDELPAVIYLRLALYLAPDHARRRNREAGIRTDDAFELLLAIRRIGPKRLEELYGPGAEDAAAPRGRKPRSAKPAT